MVQWPKPFSFAKLAPPFPTIKYVITPNLSSNKINLKGEMNEGKHPETVQHDETLDKAINYVVTGNTRIQSESNRNIGYRYIA